MHVSRATLAGQPCKGARDYACTVRRVRCENSVVTNEGKARWRNQCRKTPQCTSKVLRVQAGMREPQVIMDPYERRLLATRSPFMHAAHTSLFVVSALCACACAAGDEPVSGDQTSSGGNAGTTTSDTGGAGGSANPTGTGGSTSAPDASTTTGSGGMGAGGGKGGSGGAGRGRRARG